MWLILKNREKNRGLYNGPYANAIGVHNEQVYHVTNRFGPKLFTTEDAGKQFILDLRKHDKESVFEVVSEEEYLKLIEEDHKAIEYRGSNNKWILDMQSRTFGPPLLRK